MRKKQPWVLNTRYTCPILMLLQSWLLRQKWEFREDDGWRLLESPYVIARCRAPVWTINVEYRFWNRFINLIAWARSLKARLNSL